MAETNLSELSVTVGSLRAQITNLEQAVSRMVESQARIVDSLTENRESAAGFKEYRGTLHERFNNIHNSFGDIDDHLGKHDIRFDKIERDIGNRFDTMLVKLENVAQSLELRYEHRLVALEKQQTEWKASLRTSYSIAFFIATIAGSLLGYLVDILFHTVAR